MVYCNFIVTLLSSPQVEDKDEDIISTAWQPLTEFTRSLLSSADTIQMPAHVEKSIDGQSAA